MAVGTAVGAALVLAGCSREPVVIFSIRNDCHVPIGAAVEGDRSSGNGTFVQVEVGSHRIVQEPSRLIKDKVTLYTSPEGDYGVAPLELRKLTVPDGMRGGSGTRDDPYVVVADGGLCIPAAPEQWQLDLEQRQGG